MHKLSLAAVAVLAAAAYASYIPPPPPQYQYPQQNITHSLPTAPQPGTSNPSSTTSITAHQESPVMHAVSSGSSASSTTSGSSGNSSPSDLATGSGSPPSDVPTAGPIAPSPTGSRPSALPLNVPSPGPVAPYPIGGNSSAPVGTSTSAASIGASSPSNPETPMQTGDITLTYTETFGSSTAVKTKTIKSTRLNTNYKVGLTRYSSFSIYANVSLDHLRGTYSSRPSRRWQYCFARGKP